MTLNTQETATVLAALRLWQESIVESEKDYGKQNLFDNLPDRFRDFFNDPNLPVITFPLDAEEIDALCERINLGEERHNYIVSCDGDANIEYPIGVVTREEAMKKGLDMIGYSILYNDNDLEGEEDENLYNDNDLEGEEDEN